MTRTTRAALTVAVVVSTAAAGAAALVGTHPRPDIVQGQVEATEVDVSPRIPGRVQTVLAREGERVAAGQPLAVLESAEVDARVAQAEAARAAAQAQGDKALRGAREEELRQARAQLERAQEAATLARLTRDRLGRLHADGVVPAQRREEAEAGAKSADAALAAAQAGYDMAVSGTRVEDKEAAVAGIARAAAAVAEAQAYQREARVVSPIAGEVARRVVDPGELVAPGVPVFTVVDLSDTWATFSLREDRLAGLRVGDRLRGQVPALGREVDVVVFYIAPLGDFATWRATSAAGGFDQKTFEVRARPGRAEQGLRPGMTVVVDWSARR